MTAGPVLWALAALLLIAGHAEAQDPLVTELAALNLRYHEDLPRLDALYAALTDAAKGDAPPETLIALAHAAFLWGDVRARSPEEKLEAYERGRQAAERAVARAPARKPLDADAPPVWSLALDEICSCGVEMAPRLPFNGPRDFTGPRRAPVALAKAAAPLSQILQPIRLDPITVADDDRFLEITAQQPNVSQPVREGLAGLY